MLASIVETGSESAYTLLRGLAGRTLDASPAWDAVADEVFEAQRAFWLTDGDGEWGSPSEATGKRDRRAGRDGRMMRDTGGLERHSTIRGAQRQQVQVHSTYVLVDVTSGLAVIHEALGRDVLKEPSAADADRYAARVLDYILTGEL